MNIAVCEDDKTSRDYETQLLKKWAEQNNHTVTINTYSSAENFIFEAEDKPECDLIILDIQMGKMNGFELAKFLREKGYTGQIIFLTGITDYAVEGYEVSAIRYILKPVKEKVFFDVLDLVWRDFEKLEKEVFLLQTGSDIIKIPFSHIYYIEADGHYVILFGKDGADSFEKKWKETFNSAAGQFDKKNFFLLSRGLLVNLLHVAKITRTECFLDDGKSLPVARNNYQNLNEAFINFYRSSEKQEKF